MNNFSDINNLRVYIGDKPVATATSCKIECDEPTKKDIGWNKEKTELTFKATIKNPTYLLAFRLEYGVTDWLEWHDDNVKRLFYAYKMTYL